MEHIRKATPADLARIAEIEIFNYRLYFYPIFQNDSYYFDELQVPALAKRNAAVINSLWVYDDGAVKGFFRAADGELHKLFVEPVLHSRGIGSALLKYALQKQNIRTLWALEKNTRAIAFYQRHSFRVTQERRPVDDTAEYLVRLER